MTFGCSSQAVRGVSWSPSTVVAMFEWSVGRSKGVGMASEIGIDGFVHSDFDRVRSTFAENLEKRGEVGAAVAVYIAGEPVVDLWGGVTVESGERKGRWESDTLVCMFSVNKGVVSICGHRLADHGLLDYDTPVAHYWPEFAQAGKEEITVRQLMSGMAALVYPDGVRDGAGFDWDSMVNGLAKTAPAWPVGTQGAYHGSTYGHLVGELIRRITGQTPDEYFRTEIGDPLEIDYWFSVPPGDRHRISEVLPNPESLAAQLEEGMREKIGRAWGRILPSPDIVGLINDPRYVHEVMPAAWGKGNARAIGKLYAALSLGGTLHGYTVMSADTLREATSLQWEGVDPVTDRHHRYAMGLFLNTPGYLPLGPNMAAFGHPGASGSLGFADPDRQLAFGYSTNFMATGQGIGDRCEALIDSVFASL